MNIIIITIVKYVKERNIPLKNVFTILKIQKVIITSITSKNSYNSKSNNNQWKNNNRKYAGYRGFNFNLNNEYNYEICNLSV